MLIKNRLVLHYISTPMKLMMYIGTDLIESVPLEIERISKPGYVGQFKRTLKSKYGKLIRQQAMTPDFLIVKSISPLDSRIS